MKVLKSYREYDENGEDTFVALIELDARFEADIHYAVVTNVSALQFDTIKEAEKIFTDVLLIRFIK